MAGRPAGNSGRIAASERAKRMASERRNIISECKRLINDNDLKDIKLPSGRSSIKTWEETKDFLLTQLKELYYG